MKIITAGAGYLDIDAYAGIIAYAELLQKQGQPAQAVSTAAPNESVTKTVRSWPVLLKTEYQPRPDDTFTLIDISTPEYFDSFVDLGRLDAVIDHHPGHEAYWQDKIGDGADIEPVGAACTQVYEYWQRAGLLNKMSKVSARLLMCGILDNTLNFGAQISTKRDKDAYQQLSKIAKLPPDWPAQYFKECQEAIDKNPLQAIQNDTKTIQFPSLTGNITVGQFAVWDAAELVKKSQADLLNYFEAQNNPWFINIIAIGERKSYFIASDPKIQQWLGEFLDISFNGPFAVASRLWLRKEIIQADINRVDLQ